MSLRFWLSKLEMYYKYKGLFYVLNRGVQKIRILTYMGPYVFFCADLTEIKSNNDILPAGISVEMHRDAENIFESDYRKLSKHKDEYYLHTEMKERFTKGALLWFVKVHGEFAGYIWTTKGTTIEPYIQTLASNEVHFFDNYIFENFRGQGINPILVNYVLCEMEKQNFVRAFIETRLINTAEIRSLSKTYFRKCGLAKKIFMWKQRHVEPWYKLSHEWKYLSDDKIQMEVYESFEEVSHIQPEWDHFVESLNSDIFLTYDWCRIWWKYYGDSKALRIFVFRLQGKLVGLIPTYIEKIGITPVAIKIARIVGTTYVLAEINPPVTGKYIEQVFGQWLDCLYSRFKLDVVCTGPISGTYTKTDQLAKGCVSFDHQHFIVDKRETEVVTIFRLGTCLDDYFAGLSSKERHEMKRHCRNILKVVKDNNPRLTSEFVSTAGLDKAFDDFIRMHNSQWRQLGQSGHFNDWPKSKEFHREVAEAQLKHGRLRLLKLSIGSRCIGYEYAYKFSRTYFHYLNARTLAPEFKRIAIGKVTFKELAQKAFSEGVNLINSMRGRYRYKLRMGGELVLTHAVLVFRKGLLTKFRVIIFRNIARILNLCYYKIWFSRLAPKLHLRRRALWDIWIRTNVFVY